MFATIQTLLNSINNISTNQKLTNLEYFIKAVVKTTKANIYLFQMNNNQLNNIKTAQQNYTEAIEMFFNLLDNYHLKQITINEAQIILEILKHVIQTQNTLRAARSIQYN